MLVCKKYVCIMFIYASLCKRYVTNYIIKCFISGLYMLNTINYINTTINEKRPILAIYNIIKIVYCNTLQ